MKVRSIARAASTGRAVSHRAVSRRAVTAVAAFASMAGTSLSLLALAPSAATAQGGELKRWTVDDVLAMKTVSDVVISPDGKRVAYVVTTRDRESDVANSDIWVVSAAGGTPVQITQGPRADRAPQWAADGSWIAFLSNRSDDRRTQVYGIDPSGGEAWPITRHETGVTQFALSPDGKRLLYLATAPASRADQDLEKERGRPTVRDSAYASEWSRIWSLTVGARAAAEGRLASPEGLHVTDIVWGPDSRAVAFTARGTPLLRGDYQSSAAYVQSEPGAEARRVMNLPGADRVAGWPNEPGLIVAAAGEAIGTANERLWHVPLTGAPPVPLTDAIDESPRYVAATARELIVEVTAKTGAALLRIPMAAGKPAGPPQRLTDDRRFYGAFSAARAGDAVAFLAESASEPPDVHVSPVASFAAKRLTTVNPQAAAFAHGAQRVVAWKSAADSESIEGVLSLPVGYQEGTRVPLVLVIHGGPSGVSSARYPSVNTAYPVQVFNAMGYAVLQPNYRGSTGYGARFRGLNKGDIMGKDWVDVNSGVDAMIRAGIADSTKLGVMGWSFGGFHTFWGITQTPRYAAASAGAGANDFTSFYSQTDISEALSSLMDAAPWENYDRYAQRSAYRYVSKVTTPLLIQVGEADRRVSPEQSIQFYEAMKGVGKAPVKLVTYPGQGHGFTSPRLLRDRMRRNVDWFAYWMPANGPKPPVRVENGPGQP